MPTSIKIDWLTKTARKYLFARLKAPKPKWSKKRREWGFK